VLKAFQPGSDESNAAEVLKAFDGKGMVRILDQAEGAVLLERLVPGTSLVDLVLSGNDEAATTILAHVIDGLGRPEPPSLCVRVEAWGLGFGRYLESKDQTIPKALVEEAQKTYLALCDSQTQRRLLHGDLHHANVLFDASRGWLAIDPKGVVGELEYEVGAALRNPIERPELYASAEIVQRRLDRLAESLRLDRHRALRWTFAQAVLSAIWFCEDGVKGEEMDGALQLAEILR